MSLENSELNAINDIYESNIDMYKELMGIDDDRDLKEYDLNLMWNAAVHEFCKRVP